MYYSKYWSRIVFYTMVVHGPMECHGLHSSHTSFYWKTLLIVVVYITKHVFVWTVFLLLLFINYKIDTTCKVRHMYVVFWSLTFVVPHALAEAGDITLIRLSVTKTLTCLISFEVIMIKHWFFKCMILNCDKPFQLAPCCDLCFDLLPSKFVAARGTTILRIFYRVLKDSGVHIL